MNTNLRTEDEDHSRYNTQISGPAVSKPRRRPNIDSNRDEIHLNETLVFLKWQTRHQRPIKRHFWNTLLK